MRILYFDCFSGASGDKILGALIDAGLSFDDLKTELNKLDVSGFELTVQKVVKNGIAGTQVQVRTEEQKSHRHLKDIVKIIDQSRLSPSVKNQSIAIFKRLAEAEAKIHNTTPEKIHFHEVGALDAIVDIVGAVIGLSLLKIDQVHCSPIRVGTGFVECEHGIIPVPAPATLELLKGIPIRATEINSELTTPTGAAILTTVTDYFGPMPDMVVEKIGYGAGTRDLTIPNHLRAVLGQTNTDGIQSTVADLIETNIDDMNPEYFDHVCDRLKAAGAVDIFMTPVQMKKNRPAVMLSVLTPTEHTDQVVETIFHETTSIGVRQRQVTKKFLPREIVETETVFGRIRVKVCTLRGEVVNIAPEYDDCRKAALEHNKPISEIYEIARHEARRYHSERK